MPHYVWILFACVLFLNILAVAKLVYSLTRKPKPSNRLRVTMSANMIYLTALSLWPFLFLLLCRSVQADIQNSPLLLIGYVWPVLLLISRMVLLNPDHKPSKDEDKSKYQENRSTGGLMFTAAFGVGILLGAIRGVQDRQGAKLILASLLLCVAFFIPTHIFVCGTVGSQIVNVVQTCVLHIAIGILMTGIVISYFSKGQAK